MEIRKATINDASALAELSIQLGYPATGRQILDRLHPILESDEHVVMAACTTDGAVVGWIHVFLALRVESDPFAEIGGFVVAEEHRSRGIGRRLLASAEKWVMERGIRQFRVRSQVVRVGAHDFYTKMGFSKKKEQVVFDKELKPFPGNQGDKNEG